MAPFKGLKEYTNKRKKPLPDSEKALNTLICRNLKKRWETSTELSGPSKEKSLESTFDRLLNGEYYNNVKRTDFPRYIASSFEETNSSLSVDGINTISVHKHVEIGNKSIGQSSDLKLSPIVILERSPLLKKNDHSVNRDESKSQSYISSPSIQMSRNDMGEVENSQTNGVSNIEKNRSFENKIFLLSSLELMSRDNESLCSTFENSVTRKTTPFIYYTRKRRKSLSNNPLNLEANYSLAPSSLVAMETILSDSGNLDETNDHLDLLQPTTSSTPINKKSFSNSETLEKENSLLRCLTPEYQFEDSSKSLLRMDHHKKSVALKQAPNIYRDSKLSRKAHVILKHNPQLDDLVRNVLTKSSPIQMKFINVRKNNFVTKRKAALPNNSLRHLSNRRNTVFKSFKFNRKSNEKSEYEYTQYVHESSQEKADSMTMNSHKCYLSCEHFKKIPEVVLTRFDFSPRNLSRKSSNNSILSTRDSSLTDFKGFGKDSKRLSSIEQLSHDKTATKAEKSVNKFDFQSKKCWVVVERMKTYEVSSDEEKLEKKECSDHWTILSDSEINSKLSESSVSEDVNYKSKTTNFVTMEPGKKFRRSIAIFRNQNLLTKLDGTAENVFEQNSHRTSVKLIPSSKRRSSYNNELVRFDFSNSGYDSIRQSARQSSLEQVDNSLSDVESVNDYLHCHSQNIADQPTARDIVLKRCGQTKPINFSECYPTSALQHCQKLGEGVFGEVFMKKDKNGTTVMKVIPIEGEQIVNLEKQKTFGEILSEIIISLELSNLRTTKRNHTDAFVEVKAIRCVEGCYPERLLELWELYDENKKSENDSPEMFLSDQLYIVLELENVGRDLESYQFNNAQQALSVFEQVACALAVAESEMQFEHRDLHWGNVLIKPTDEKNTVFVLDGKEIVVNNRGVKASIIDFTLSRVEYGGLIIFNDLSHDQDLFTAKGDYQFDIYRKMQENNGNDWQPFKPYSNILWLHYLLRKAIDGFRYKNTKSKLHKTSLSILRSYEEQILDFNSTSEFVERNFTQILIH